MVASIRTCSHVIWHQQNYCTFWPHIVSYKSTGRVGSHDVVAIFLRGSTMLRHKFHWSTDFHGMPKEAIMPCKWTLICIWENVPLEIIIDHLGLDMNRTIEIVVNRKTKKMPYVL